MGMVYEQPLASIELTGEFEHKLEEVAQELVMLGNLCVSSNSLLLRF